MQGLGRLREVGALLQAGRLKQVSLRCWRAVHQAVVCIKRPSRLDARRRLRIKQLLTARSLDCQPLLTAVSTKGAISISARLLC